MRPTLILAALAALIATPALAQNPDKKSAPPTDCSALVAWLDIVETSPETVIEDVPGGCRMTDFFVDMGSYVRYRADELVLTAPDLFEAVAAMRPFAEAELTVSGLRLSPDTGSPLTTYIIEMQSAPLDARVSYRWDAAAETVDLTELSVKSVDFGGGFSVSGAFSGIVFDPARLEDISQWPGAIDRLNLTLDDGRFFTAYAAPAVLGLLPYDADPRPLIETYKQAATAFIDGLPDASVGPDSKAALRRFVADFPQPRGSYTLDLSADPGLPFVDIAVDDPMQVVALLARLAIVAGHTEP